GLRIASAASEELSALSFPGGRETRGRGETADPAPSTCGPRTRPLATSGGRCSEHRWSVLGKEHARVCCRKCEEREEAAEGDLRGAGGDGRWVLRHRRRCLLRR